MNAKMLAVLLGALLAIAFDWFQEDDAAERPAAGSVEPAPMQRPATPTA
jgi:hypothetical protein